MDKPYQATQEIDVLPTHYLSPAEGFVQDNAFVIKATEPVLVDTGIGIDSEDFMNVLESVIDPEDLKWIWLTHDDPDHTGSIQKVMDVATNARLVLHAVAMSRTSTAWKVPIDRVYLLRPGESISVGDRKLTAVQPPLFDNPSTIGIYDNKAEAFFSVDCFGAFLPSIGAQDADKVKEADLAHGMITFAKVNTPWVHTFDQNKFSQRLNKIRQIAPEIILPTHLMPARRKTEQFLKMLADIPGSEPWVAPNQAALEKRLAQMRGVG